MLKFYLALGAIGSKCDCRPLWNKVNEAFPQMANDLDDIELRIWGVAYNSGPLRYPDHGDDHKKIKITRGWVQRLCTEDEEEFIDTFRVPRPSF